MTSYSFIDPSTYSFIKSVYNDLDYLLLEDDEVNITSLLRSVDRSKYGKYANVITKLLNLLVKRLSYKKYYELSLGELLSITTSNRLDRSKNIVISLANKVFSNDQVFSPLKRILFSKYSSVDEIKSVLDNYSRDNELIKKEYLLLG